jgi:hypothetical protein
MNVRVDEALIAKLQSLPPQQRAEVEDFIDFLKARQERLPNEAALRLGEAFAKLDSLTQLPLSAEHVQAEIDAARPSTRSRL